MSETGITETDFPSAVRQKAQGSTDLPFWFAVAYEIESLRRQLAAQKLEWEKAYGIGVTCKQQLADTQRLLAESQARENKLREGIDDYCDTGMMLNPIALRDLHSDSSALDAAIAKAKREENEVCEGICNRFAGREMHPAECAAAIRMRRMADELKCGEQ